MARKHRQSQATHDDNMNDSPPCYDHSFSDYQKHPTFYTEDVFFELNDTIFKFPKYYLRDSLAFKRNFTIPEYILATSTKYVNVSGDGTPQSPFSSTEIDRKALESFLALHRTSIYDPEPGIVGKDKWLDVLKVSYFWKMESLGKFAVSQLSKIALEGVEKLKLAKRYDIQDKEWMLSAIRELIKTDAIFPDVDVQEIGVDIVQRICTLRGMRSQRFFAISDANIKEVFPELASPKPVIATQ